MEDILEVYSRPHDPKKPVVCMDEMNKQCIKEIRSAIPMIPGKPARYDSEYERNGSLNIFLCNEPLVGKRFAKVTDRRTRVDWAFFIRDLVDKHFGEAEKITLVLDNLNTHTPGSLYEAFSPNEARRLLDKLELHYTPKHGSWLNVAEIELSVLSRQCLDRRMPDKETYEKEVAAWEEQRNSLSIGVDWQFKTKDARIKLKRLYPKNQLETQIFNKNLPMY
jgi:hypothetical protein